jgi:hypothetical protein
VNGTNEKGWSADSAMWRNEGDGLAWLGLVCFCMSILFCVYGSRLLVCVGGRAASELEVLSGGSRFLLAMAILEGEMLTKFG